MKRHILPLAATVLAIALLAGCGDDEPSEADDPATTAASQDDSETAPTAPSEPDDTETSTGGAETVTVPIYFVGETPQGPKLFREFRQVEADNPLEEAAALLTAGDTVDPDYTTLYPGGGFASVTADSDQITAELPDDGWNTPAPGMSKAEARLAVQQLVYTLQGVAQDRKPVVLTLGGAPADVFFGLDASSGFRAAPQPDVLALVNVTTPEQGATVSGTFTADGVANSFEATVPWEIRDASGEDVLDGFSTAGGWGDKLYPWQAEVDVSGLEPGEYTFAALTDDPSGGEGGGPTEDTKEIVVE